MWPNVSTLLILLFLWLTSPPLPCRRKFLRAAVTGGWWIWWTLHMFMTMAGDGDEEDRLPLASLFLLGRPKRDIAHKLARKNHVGDQNIQSWRSQDFQPFFLACCPLPALIITDQCCIVTGAGWGQTWYLSKNLHHRIFRLKILHRQFHLTSTVLVG